MEVRRIWPKGWRAIVLLLVGSVMGANLIAPAVAHVAGWNHNWTAHIKPRTDARYLPLVVRPGQTIRGTVGAQWTAPGTDETGANAQLQAAARVGLTDATVNVVGSDDSGACTGTSANPTAPPGQVCIYPYSVSNAETLRGYVWGGGDGTKWGFQLSWFAVAAGDTYVFANWAYRAPLSTTVAAPSGASESSSSPEGAGGE